MCGVFGLVSPDRDVSRVTFFALYALQHRGQESAGIAVGDGHSLTVSREMGLVSQAFNESALRTLDGDLAIGHTRYSTTGATVWQNAQPVLREGRRVVSLAHNGNLTNTTELRERLIGDGVRFDGTGDTEVMAALIAEHPGTTEQAITEAMRLAEGAFASVVATRDAVYGFRDRSGIRPLVLGQFDDGSPCVASESCAFDLIGARLVREVRPGELVRLDPGGATTVAQLEGAREKLCVFEHIYFARPDSRMGGQTLYTIRERMGARLHAEAPAPGADLVVPVPDSGTPAATGFARAARLPFGEAFIKNRYVGRTFIAPDDEMRQRGIRTKFNPIPDAVAGRSLVVVDDSIVRGNTTRALVAMLFEAGAREVHLRISSPPIKWPCFYGIDMADQEQLIASHLSIDEIRESSGATSLAYLSHEGLQVALDRPAAGFCRACFTGDYPTEIGDELRLTKLRFESVPS